MHFPTDPKLLALLPFTAFLANHIDTIRPSVIVFLYAPGHTDYVAQIVERLAGRQMHFIRATNASHPMSSTIWYDALFLSFLGPYFPNNSWVRFESSLRSFVIRLEDGPSATSGAGGGGGVFEVIRQIYKPSLCIGWRNTRSTRSPNEMLEADFLRSYYWPVFTNRITGLIASEDGHRWLSIFDTPDTDRMSSDYYRDAARTELVVTGTRMGIYKILGEKLHAKYLRYFNNNRFLNRHRFWMAVRDTRLTAVMRTTEQGWINIMSLFPTTQYFTYQFPHMALQTRYVVTVPRIVVDSASNRMKAMWMKAIVVVGLMLSTAFLVMVRFVCRLGEDGRWPVDGSAWWVHSLFDTWARTLSVGAGQWMGRSRAERQMLTVIAVFAFLSGSIFSGVLYEQLLDKDEVKFLYNTLDDLCLAGKEIFIAQNLIPDYSFGNQIINGSVFLPSSNCTLNLTSVSPENHTETATVIAERTLRTVIVSKQMSMILKEPYLIYPGMAGVYNRFMEKLVAKWLTQLSDHGLLEASRRTADNYEEMLKRKRRLLGWDIVEDPQPVDPMFEYWVLAVGLSMAGLAFVGELVAGGRLTWGTFGWGAGRLRAFAWRNSNRVQSLATTGSV